MRSLLMLQLRSSLWRRTVVAVLKDMSFAVKQALTHKMIKNAEVAQKLKRQCSLSPLQLLPEEAGDTPGVPRALSSLIPQCQFTLLWAAVMMKLRQSHICQLRVFAAEAGDGPGVPCNW